MILFLVTALALAAAALFPALRLLAGGDRSVRGRREAALELHREEFRALDRDASLGLVDPAEQAGARLELQRRLLAADALPPEAVRAGTSGRALFAAALLAIPLMAAALYAIGGHPTWPADPLGPRLAGLAHRNAAADAAIARLRAGLATLPPGSRQVRGGDILLGNVEARLGRWADAASAWRAALAIDFDPLLADEVAEADIAATGQVSDDDARLLRRALAAAPAGAAWRLEAEARLAQSEHQ